MKIMIVFGGMVKNVVIGKVKGFVGSIGKYFVIK